jgi:hypothetical protein
VSVNDVRITDAGRSGNDAAGVGLDALSTHSSAISLTQLHVFDTDTIAQLKKMAFCIDFGQGGTTSGVVIGGNLFDDGVNALGCRIGTVNFNNASRVTAY